MNVSMSVTCACRFYGTIRRMKKLALLIVVAGLAGVPQAAADKDVAGWEKQAQTHHDHP